MMVLIGRNRRHRPAPSTTHDHKDNVTNNDNKNNNMHAHHNQDQQRHQQRQIFRVHSPTIRLVVPQLLSPLLETYTAFLLKTMSYINANKLSNLNRILSLINCPCRH